MKWLINAHDGEQAMKLGYRLHLGGGCELPELSPRPQVQRPTPPLPSKAA